MDGSDILREVDESLRVEKAIRFWEDNGKTIMLLIAAIILGTAAQSGWTAYKHSQQEQQTSRFFDALQSDDALTKLQNLGKGGKGTGASLAAINAASIAIGKDDWATAIINYQFVITNKDASPAHKDLAIVQRAAIQMDHDAKSTAPDLLAALEPVIVNPKSPWASRALLLSALIKAEKSNDIPAARSDLKKILQSTGLSDSLQQYVTELDNVYKIKSGASE